MPDIAAQMNVADYFISREEFVDSVSCTVASTDHISVIFLIVDTYIEFLTASTV
jgi:hypothetical protein